MNMKNPKNKRAKQYCDDYALSFSLDDEQKAVRSFIMNNDISVLVGIAGSGKTALACYVGLEMLLQKKVEKLIITRPTVATEELGFLKGDMEEKFTPWMRPIIDNLNKMYPASHIEAKMHSKAIEMLPLQYTRGITYDNAFVILDEAQNTTIQQIKMVMTRLGEESKMVLCGDLDQIDLKDPNDSGLTLVRNFSGIDKFTVMEMKNEHRKKIVKDLLDKFKLYGH